MTLKSTALHRPFRRSLGKYSHASQPLGVGLVAIFVIAATILVLGDAQVERTVVRSAGSGHERDLLRFSEVLHYSGLSISGPDAGENLPQLAQTAVFDRAVKRALFGLNAERMDIYTLEGAPVYSTAGVGSAPGLGGRAVDAFREASAGRFMSLFRGAESSKTAFGSDAELLQSFALIRDVPPDSVNTGRPLMVAAITTDISAALDETYATLWLVVAVFFFGSLVILSVVHWASVRSRARLQAANDALAVQNMAVRESRERMIAAADATKRAIAEELHGSVQTRLFMLWMRLSQVREKSSGNDTDIAELDSILQELDDVRESDIRGLSHRLHPSIVRVSAVHALKSLCDRMSGELTVRLHADHTATALEPAGASPIPESVRLAVFRIVELAIGNTIKHASATRCDVHWSYSEREQALKLSVEDDGIGFDASDLSSSGLGIVNIQDYTDAMDGAAVLDSEPGKGTRLTVTIPFVPERTTALLAKPRPASNVTPFEQRKAA